MRTWLGQHARACKDALGRIGSQLISAILSIAVIGIALALPSALYIATKNLSAFTRQLSTEPQITLFLDVGASSADAEAIEKRLKQHAGIATVRFVAKADALNELKSRVDIAKVVDEIGRNPLPDAFVVTAKSADPATLEKLQDETSAWPKVELAQVDTAWARKLDDALKIGRAVVGVLTGLLGIAIVAITFNTIRLQVLTRREEIEISKLIGATNAYVRRPFLYFGGMQGLLGGLAAWAILGGAIAYLNARLLSSGLVSAAGDPIKGLTATEVGGLVLGAAVMGWIGAWLSSTQHLWRSAPH